MVQQSGWVVPLANLSSGDAYLIQKMSSPLGTMCSVHVLRGAPPEELCNAPGPLLIDEAETTCTRNGTSRFLRNILDAFPNFQIIAATHSPLLPASSPGGRKAPRGSKSEPGKAPVLIAVCTRGRAEDALGGGLGEYFYCESLLNNLVKEVDPL
jgi:hypothetical protein